MRDEVRVRSDGGAVASARREFGPVPRVGNALKRSLRGDLGPGTPVERLPAGWPSKRFRRLTGLAAGVAFALAVLALAGHAWGNNIWLTALVSGRSMPPLTAAGLMMCSLTVVLLLFDRRGAAKGIASFCVLSGLLTLVPLLTPLRSADLFRLAEDLNFISLGRIALMPGLSFILFGLAALTITATHSGPRTFGVACGSAGLAVTLLSIFGNVLVAGRPLSALDAVLVMPLQTAIGLAAVFGALLLVRPHASWIGILLADDSRARVARILLLSAVVPVPLGWLVDKGYRSGLYGADARLLLVVLSAVLLLTMLALASAVMIGDERRDRVEIARALDLSASVLQDLEGTILYWSKGCEDLYGWTAEEAEGKNCGELLGACVPDFQRRDTLLLQDDAWQGELQHRTRDGRTLWVSARWVPYRSGDGRSPVTLVTFNDVSTKHQAQAALQERDARLLQLQAELIEVSRLSSMGEMAAALAHELNQPLTAAANFLGAAEMMLPGGERTPRPAPLGPVGEAISRAKDEALRAGEIVRRLREFISRGEADMKRESLPAIIKNAVLLGLAKVEHKSIDVDYQFDTKAQFVLADRIQIQQVIVNIVRNAAEAMGQQPPDGRRLSISTAAAGDKSAEIVIGDTGPGLTEEVIATLFTPFTSSKVTGMGVGLSICKRIVEAHGGRIWAGERPGGGAEFHFTLSLFEQPEELDE